VTAQSGESRIVPSLTAQLLSWTHYDCLLQVSDKAARDWYEKEQMARLKKKAKEGHLMLDE